MESLAAFLDKRFVSNFDPWKDPVCEDFDQLTAGRRTRYIGFVLDKDAVMLDWKRLASFRIRIPNLAGALPRLRLSKINREILKPPYEREQMKRYLADNEDNPFGVWNALQSIMQLPKLEHITQFPPLMYPKSNQRAALDAMREKVEIGDAIFTYDRSSGLARLIRRWDWCMWSHTGMSGDDGSLYEATTAGTVKSSFDRLYDESLDVGLYRPRGGLTPEQKKKMIEFLDGTLGRKGYPWGRVIRIGLQKNLGIPYRRGPIERTGADLMHSNNLELICYA